MYLLLLVGDLSRQRMRAPSLLFGGVLENAPEHKCQHQHQEKGDPPYTYDEQVQSIMSDMLARTQTGSGPSSVVRLLWDACPAVDAASVLFWASRSC